MCVFLCLCACYLISDVLETSPLLSRDTRSGEREGHKERLIIEPPKYYVWKPRTEWRYVGYSLLLKESTLILISRLEDLHEFVHSTFTASEK
jgi:hypothetical protein